MTKVCPLRTENPDGIFKNCLEEKCAWYDDEIGACEITNLSLISKLPTELDTYKQSTEST